MGCKIGRCDDNEYLCQTQDYTGKQENKSSNANCNVSTSAGSTIKQSSIFCTVKEVLTKQFSEKVWLNEAKMLVDFWEICVYNPLLQSIIEQQDIQTKIEYFGSGDRIKIIHEVDGWKNVQLLQHFCQQTAGQCKNLKSPVFQTERFTKIVNLIKNFGVITVIVYLDISENMDIGVIMNHAFTKNQMRQFLQTNQTLSEAKEEKSKNLNLVELFSDSKMLFQWSQKDPQPFCTKFGWSLLNDICHIGFYSFDASRESNFGKAFSIFDTQGVPLSSEIKAALQKAKGEEVSINVSLILNKVDSMSVEVGALEPNEQDQISGQIEAFFDLKKWKNIEAAFYLKNYILRLDNYGFGFNQVVQLVNNASCSNQS